MSARFTHQRQRERVTYGDITSALADMHLDSSEVSMEREELDKKQRLLMSQSSLQVTTVQECPTIQVRR